MLDIGNASDILNDMENTKLLEKMMKYIFEKMVTKDDLVRFATKDDLNDFAKKSDLNRFATKDDFAKFATKDDLVGVETRVTTLIHTEIDGIAMSTAKGFAEAKKDHYELQQNLQDTEVRLSQKINSINNHAEKVEDDVRRVKTVLKMA